MLKRRNKRALAYRKWNIGRILRRKDRRIGEGKYGRPYFVSDRTKTAMDEIALAARGSVQMSWVAIFFSQLVDRFKKIPFQMFLALICKVVVARCENIVVMQVRRKSVKSEYTSGDIYRSWKMFNRAKLYNRSGEVWKQTPVSIIYWTLKSFHDNRNHFVLVSESS